MMTLMERILLVEFWLRHDRNLEVSNELFCYLDELYMNDT